MNISQVANASGLPAKTIRYYEDIGLLSAPRDDNGYRNFGERQLHSLTFLGRARALGFSIEECRTLIALYEDQGRASADVKRVASDHLQQIEQKIADLQSMHDTLSTLVHQCAGDDRPDCPILKDLAGTATHHGDRLSHQWSWVGKRKLKQVMPLALLACASPPWAWAMARVMASPRPAPSAFGCARAASAR